jgi:hypothetical protein
MLWQVTENLPEKKESTRSLTACEHSFKMWGDHIKTPNSLPYRTKFGRKVSVSAFTQAFFDQFQFVRLITIVISSPETQHLGRISGHTYNSHWLKFVIPGGRARPGWFLILVF